MFLMAAVGCGCRPLRFLLGLSNRSSQSADDRSVVLPSVPLEMTRSCREHLSADLVLRQEPEDEEEDEEDDGGEKDDDGDEGYSE
jgi:hypothetical protein